MKTKTIYIILMALLLWSCSDEDERNIKPDGTNSIKFELGFESTPKIESRLITTPDFTTSWQVGDKVGVYIVKGNKGLQAQNNYVDNLKLEYNGSKWISNEDIYYPNDGDKLHFYAYYPYQDNANQDATALTFSVQKDQRGEAYSMSDFLTASTIDVAKSATNVVQLQFSHVMSLVQIEVEKEEFVPELTDDFTVRMIFTQSETNINLETGKQTINPNVYSDIVMHKVSDMPYTYRALIPAQKFTLYSKVKFSQKTEGAVIDMDYLGLIQKDVKAGAILKRKITLGREEGFETLPKYKVGDYYPDPDVVYENKKVISGTPAKGIVFWLEPNTGGTHGLVLSLDEMKSKRWNLVNTETNATDIDNGLENMKIIEQYIENTPNAKWADFPAFEWIHVTKNGGNARYDEEMLNVWYMPARLEIKKMFAAYCGKIYEEIIGWGNTNNMPGYNTPEVIDAKAILDKKLVDANGNAFSFGDFDHRYSTSSEFSLSNIWNTSFRNGYTVSSGIKTGGIYTTRPILAF